MSEALERIRAILSRELPDAEVQDLVTELTIASGRGAVAIDGDAMEAVIITGSQNIVGDNNRVVINQGTNPEELVKMLRNLVQEMQQVDSTPELSPEELQDATLAFLQDIAGKFRETQLFHTKQPIILKDQYVPIQVTLEPHKRDVETLRGYWETEEELKRAYALRGGEEELKRQQVDWQEAKQTHQRIMVLADPGMGKSTLLRMEAGSTAERKLQTLQQDETTLDRLTLPLFLRLSELAKRPEELIETIPFLIQRDYPNTAPLILPLLTQKLKTGKCLLLLDALDEVPKIDRNRIELKEKVDRFMQNYPCPVICTSRIVGYDGNFLVGGQEVEIVPFGEQQIEQYVTTWFTNAAEHISDESVSAAELMRELHSKPQVRGLVQNPLLLSLICSLYQEKGLTLPARRTQVYEKAVEYMLMKWSKEKRNPRQGEEDWADLKQELLEELAYQFSCEDTEVVSRRDLRRKIDQYLRGEEVPSEFRNVTASDLLVELTEQDGILQKLAPDGDQYLFLHRTFQEYLTASYLARARGGIELAQAHFWEYDWHETICLMAGLLEDPIPLLKTIISERDDSFYSLLLLAGQCVTECENSSHGLMHEICERIYSLWRSHPSVIFFSTTVRLLAQSNRWVLEKLLYESLNDSSKVISFGSVQIIGEIATPQMTSALAQAFENSSNHVRIGIILALGRIGDRETIEFLILALEKDNVNIRKWTLNVLRKLKKSSVIYPLIEKSFPSDHYAIDEVVTALEKAISFSIEYKAHQQEYSLLGREFIISILSSGFSFLYAESRRVIIRLLGEVGDFSANTILIDILHSLDFFVEKWLTAALEKIEQQSISVLIQMLHTDQDIGIASSTAFLASLITENLYFHYNEIRRETVIALGKIGNPQAVQALSQVLNDFDSGVRREAATALGRIGNPQAVEVLFHALNDINSTVRREVVTALGDIDSPQVIELLTRLLHDHHFDVRWRAAAALGNIGNSQAVESLISSLNHPDDDVRREAFAALGEASSLKAVITLVDLLNHEKNSKDRRWIAAALGKVRWTTESLKTLRNTQVLESLIQALDDSDIYVVRWIVVALGKLRHPKAVDALISALKHCNRDVRKYAAVALGKLRHPKAVDALISALKDHSNEVREQAVLALERIGDPRAISPLMEILYFSNNRFNFWLIRLLKRMLRKKSKTIQSANSSNSSVRCRAATALGEFKDPRATKVLARALSDPSSDVRERATVALGNIDGLQALKVLVQALSHSDRNVKKEAVHSLKRIGTRKALSRILQSPHLALSDPDIYSLIRTLTIRININNQDNRLIAMYRARGRKMRLILCRLTSNKKSTIKNN